MKGRERGEREMNRVNVPRCEIGKRGVNRVAKHCEGAGWVAPSVHPEADL